MNQETKLTFSYKDGEENKEIHFIQSEKNVMVNATDLAKVFGKRLDVFLKSDHAKAFIETLKLTPYGGSFSPLTDNEIIQTRSGSRTYFHRILALKFAAWLDPRFEVWVYATIEQILYGHYQELEESLKNSARRKVEIDQIQRELFENERYQRLEQLKLQEKQATYQRAKYSKGQLDIFQGMYHDDYQEE